MRYLLITALILVVPDPVFAHEGIPLKTISHIERSVIPLVCAYKDASGTLRIAGVAGTGFFVDRHGRFVTDAHVLNDLLTFRGVRPCFPVFYVPDHRWGAYEPIINFQYFPFVRCTTNKVLDLAVCSPTENPFTSKRLQKGSVTTVSFGRNDAKVGAPVGFTGFPLQSKAPISSQGHVAGFTGVQGDPTGFDYFIDKAAWPGASGSPLYLANGRVVGIVRAAGEKAGSGISLARSSALITAFLAKHPYGGPARRKKKQRGKRASK